MSDQPTYLPIPFTAATLRGVAVLWSAALLLSALLVGAGRLRADPLPVQAAPILALVFVPPLAMALWLLRGWAAVSPSSAAQPPEGGESSGANQERR